MILPKVRDPRFVTIRRGGTLTDSDHHLLALWAASCAEHVLGFFESAQPEDPRPRQAVEHARAWVRGEVTMMQARASGGHAMAAARDLHGAPRQAAFAAGQAAVVAHVAAHDLGAAAYAIKAARAAAPEGEDDAAGRRECRWQRDRRSAATQRLRLVGVRLLSRRGCPAGRQERHDRPPAWPGEPAGDPTVRSRPARLGGWRCILPDQQLKLPILVWVRTLMAVVIDESREVVRFAQHRQEAA